MKHANNPFTRKVALILAIALLVISCAGLAYAVGAAVLSARGQFRVKTLAVNATSTFTVAQSDSFALSYTQSAQAYTLNVVTENPNASVLALSYAFTVSGTSAETLSSAILVYLNDEFVGTLSELSSATENLSGSYVPAGSTSTSGSVTDTLKFELHLAADNSLYDSDSLTLSVAAYTKSVDYSSYIFVSDSSELVHAVDDINSGLLSADDCQIVLLSDVAFASATSEIIKPCKINLNGHIISGEVTLNDSSAYLWFTGNGTNNVTVTLTSYDTATVTTLASDYVKSALASGVAEGASCKILGNNSFYLSDTATFTADCSSAINYSYNNGTITANTVERSSVEIFVFNDSEIEFSVNDSETTLADKYLAHIPDATETTNAASGETEISYTIVSSDLFLPTSIREENATIEWTSSNSEVMDNTGKIVASAENEEITLTAAISVNGVTHTRSFTFKVTARTNEANFYKLISKISPIIIYEIANETAGTGYYRLPVVSDTSGTEENPTYDYRTNYYTPSDVDEIYRYVWTAYRDIRLTSITYSAIEVEYDENGEVTSGYDYIDVDEENASVYLTKSTLDNYAEINVTGTFENGDVYSGKVIVMIATGTNAALLEEAFEDVDQALQKVNILQTLLTTRVEQGMANENCTFYLPVSVTKSGNTFKYEYTADDGACFTVGTEKISRTITDEDGNEITQNYYAIEVDPSGFVDSQSTVAINVSVVWGSTSRQRTLYFTAPAAVHTSDFGNDASLFSSVKAQVFQQLPSYEQSGETGFSSDFTTNSTADYILLRDIVGDAVYQSEYMSGSSDYLKNYLEGTGTYGDSSDDALAAKAYEGCKELWFYTADGLTSSTDAAAHDFAALIEWATGSGTDTVASLSLAHSAYVDTAQAADGNEYLTDSEIAVIKAYYIAAANAAGNTVSDDDWNELWNTVAEQEDGYTFTAGAGTISSDTLTEDSTVAEVAKIWIKKNQDSANAKNYSLKYNSILQWAANFRDNEYNPVETPYWYVNGVTVAPEQIQCELASVKYTATAPSVGDVITVNETRYYKKANGSTGTQTANTTYTCFYVDTVNCRAWYYNGTSISTESTKNKYQKYNITTYKVNCWSMGSDTSGSTITTATSGEYTLEDFNYVSYLDDDTEYLTPGEAQILFAFWYNFDGKKNAERAEAYIQAFYKYAVIPTYFLSDGVKNLMSSFYADAGISVGGSGGFSTEAETTESGSSNDGLTLAHINVAKAPAIVSCEQLDDVLHYFTQLEQLCISGTESNSAFLSEYSLSNTINRLYRSATNLNTLVCEHAAQNYVSFDLENIKEFDNLTIIDVSDNVGVTNAAPLINVNSGNYTYIDISNTSVTDEDFYNYLIENRKNAVIYYTKSSGAARTNEGAEASANAETIVSTLSDWEKLLSEYGYAVTATTDSDNIYWRIEEGNQMTLVSGIGTLDNVSVTEITTIDAMQYTVSPFYYCTSSFTCGNATFAEGCVYKITYSSSGTVSATKICDSTAISVTDSSDDIVDINGSSRTFTEKSEDELTYYSDNAAQITTFNYFNLIGSGYNHYRAKENDPFLYATANGSYLARFFCPNNTRTNSNKDQTTTRNSTETVAPDNYKLCVLTEEDFQILIGNAASGKTLGVSSLDNLYNYSVTGKTAYTKNGSAQSEYYYLYFPYADVFVKMPTESGDITVASRESVIKDPDSYKITIAYITGTLTGIGSGYTSSCASYAFCSYNATFDPSSAIFLSISGGKVVLGVLNDGSIIRGAIWEFGIYECASTCSGTSSDINNKKCTTTCVNDDGCESYIPGDSDGAITYGTITLSGANGSATVSDVFCINEQITTVYTSVTTYSYSGTASYFYTGAAKDVNYMSVTLGEYTNSSGTSFTLYQNSVVYADYNYTLLEYGTCTVSYVYTYVDSEGNTQTIDVSGYTSMTFTFADKNGTKEVTWTFKDTAHSYNSVAVIDETDIKTCYNYVNVVADSALMLSNFASATNNSVFKYTGEDGAVTYYSDGTGFGEKVSYTNGGYVLIFSDGLPEWVCDSDVLNTGSGMLDVLENANANFTTKHYGEYYGMYYAYFGLSVTVDTYTFTNGHIYRLMPNSSNSAFEFNDVGTYYTDGGSGYTLTTLMYNVVSDSWTIDGTTYTNADMVGKIIYVETGSESSNMFIATGFYEVVYSDAMGSYSIKSVCDIDYEYNETNSLAKFINCRMVSVLLSDYYTDKEYRNARLGFGGSYSVKITVFTHTATEEADDSGNTVYQDDSERPYSVEVVG